MDIITFPPFQIALLAGLAMSVTFGVLGSFVVVRREAIVGHSLSHMALFGVVLALLLGLPVDAVVLAMMFVGAGILTWFLRSQRITTDSMMEYVAQMSMAAAIVGLQFFRGYQVDPLSYLFGDILAIGTMDLWMTLVVMVIVLGALLWLRRPLLQLSLDREMAIARGMNPWHVDLLFLLLVALGVFVGIKLVGVILLGAFLILPANIAKHVSKSFSGYLLCSVMVALLGTLVGMMAALLLDLPSGPVVVFTLGLLMAGVSMIRR